MSAKWASTTLSLRLHLLSLLRACCLASPVRPLAPPDKPRHFTQPTSSTAATPTLPTNDNPIDESLLDVRQLDEPPHTTHTHLDTSVE